MKVLFLSMLCAATMGMIACTDTVKDSHPETSDEGKISLKDTISLSTYNNWTGAWIDGGQKYTDSVLTRAFTMPLIDLTEFRSENTYFARFVLGLDTSVTPEMPHLMLVGVDSLGNNMLPGPTNPNAHIFDVTVPCPPFCGFPPLE